MNESRFSDTPGSDGTETPEGRDSRRPALAELRKKDLNLLVVLAAMLESNSVSEAARRLDSTQPSMSRMLDRLRDDLGDPLLIKSAHKMLPTRRAQDIRRVLDDVLRAIEGVYQQGSDYNPAMETGTYVIGINDSLQALIAPAFLASLRQVAPRARVRMQPVPQQGGISAMTSGAIDLMVAFYPVDMESLRSELLLTTRFGCLSARSNPHIGAITSARELASLDCLDISQFGLITRLLDRYFQSHGLHRRIVGTLTSYLAVADAIHDTEIYAMIPDYLARPLCRHPGMRFSPMEDEGMAVPIHLCWHNNVHSHPFVTVLRSLLASAARHVAT
ncbi:LysR family transcriptional regulator [Cupriavidus metallidurans]|uniref:Transcriptional regulator, LysR family n=1 Tax=Cupriavidus metallidurans (strain ATCC 43123 / DSM 2839 / NBRC 102507 / CH34) TaxID=266264 RepID=Q1LCA7_CUPMC|nr:LysR family transcriptional regulator [Cupriavidus metallidurans]ABF12219.1 putative transcriptional regulator, LysR family [Cupriavidus metallidurans CH34]QGS32532.1 LysR family transcriptional regulator [Cupriavidus metallidurans]